MGVYKRGKKSFVARIARKGVRKAGQAIKKRYYGGGKVNVGQIVKDVAMVKRLINVEKKRIYTSVSNQIIGQCLGNLSGYYQTDLTPLPVESVAYNGRTGSSIKMVSFHMQMQFISQSAAVGRQNYKVYLIETLAGQISPNQMFMDNTFVGGGPIIDYNSQLNTDYFGRYRIVSCKRVSIEPDATTGQTAYRTLSFGKKHSMHIRFQFDTTTVTNKRLYMIIVGDSGNCSSTTASTLTAIPQTAVNTGATVSYNFTSYYVDN